MRPRLLIVPHVYATDVRVRGIELAQRLASSFDVYMLQVPSLAHVHAKTTSARRRRQVALGFSALARRPQLHRYGDGLTRLDYPYLDPALLKGFGREFSTRVAQTFNGWILENVVRRFGISHVLLESSVFGWRPSSPARLYLDIVDWFPEEELDSRFVAFVKQRLKELAQHATAIFTVSDPLREILEGLLTRQVVCVPNGADVRRLRAVPRSRVEPLRRSLGLNGMLVISSIGNHGDFSRLDFAASVLEEIRESISNAVLLVVGPCTDNAYRGSIPSGVIFAGSVPPDEVDAYFHLTDIGLLTQEKSSGTDFAFQIKMVEYGVCRKHVISTPLEVWRRLRWPNVILLKPNAADWAKAIIAIRGRSWEPGWDEIFEEYDWGMLADRMARVLLQ